MVIVEIHHPFHYPPTMVDHHPKGACQMVVCEVHARETGVGNWNILHQVQPLFLMWLARQTLKKNSNMQKLITFRVGDSVYALVAEGIKRKKWCHNSPKNILQESIIESIIVTLYSWRKKKNRLYATCMISRSGFCHKLESILESYWDHLYSENTIDVRHRVNVMEFHVMLQWQKRTEESPLDASVDCLLQYHQNAPATSIFAGY